MLFEIKIDFAPCEQQRRAFMFTNAVDAKIFQIAHERNRNADRVY